MTELDLTESISPKSDQLNADDLQVAPRTVTIESVTRGSAEQPFDLHLVETPGRAYRPGKSMRRVLVAAWGADASKYVGHRMTLYCDPTIRFGSAAVGGIRISAMSHLDKPLSIALTVTRGQRRPFVVQPLAEEAKPVEVDIATINDPDVLRGMWQASDKTRRAQIEARVAELATVEPEPA